jgi:hypothetical protein
MKPNCTLRTSSTNAPQALLMMNDPFMIQQVNALAIRVRDGAGTDPETCFAVAWQLVFGRDATDDQRRAGLMFLQEQTAAIRSSTPERPNPQQAALADLCHALVSSNGFLYVD